MLKFRKFTKLFESLSPNPGRVVTTEEIVDSKIFRKTSCQRDSLFFFFYFFRQRNQKYFDPSNDHFLSCMFQFRLHTAVVSADTATYRCSLRCERLTASSFQCLPNVRMYTAFSSVFGSYRTQNDTLRKRNPKCNAVFYVIKIEFLYYRASCGITNCMVVMCLAVS